MTIAERLHTSGSKLPDRPAPPGVYLPGVLMNAAPGFGEHPKAVNGCCGLFMDVFGEVGRHAQAAAGMGTLPANISVENTAIYAVTP